MSGYDRNTVRTIRQINAELEKIQEAIADQLDRSPDESQANQMETTLDMNNNPIINVDLPENPDDGSLISKGYADRTYVNIIGDTMTGTLGGINATENNHFMPRLQISELIDARIASAPGQDPDLFKDYGLTSMSVGENLDYGLITDPATEFIDYGVI